MGLIAAMRQMTAKAVIKKRFLNVTLSFWSITFLWLPGHQNASSSCSVFWCVSCSSWDLNVSQSQRSGPEHYLSAHTYFQKSATQSHCLNTICLLRIPKFIPPQAWPIFGMHVLNILKTYCFYNLPSPPMLPFFQSKKKKGLYLLWTIKN